MKARGLNAEVSIRSKEVVGHRAHSGSHSALLRLSFSARQVASTSLSFELSASKAALASAHPVPVIVRALEDQAKGADSLNCS